MSKLTLTSATTSATTYRFRGEHFSWAICTVNDATGELLITSDWGNWSHRWNVDHIGAPSLTAFIGDRNAVDYLAGKLQGSRGGQRFSAERTVAAWRRRLCERRFEGALTKGLARELWDALGDAADDAGNSADLFLDRVYAIGSFTEHIEDTPYESLEYEQTPEDKALREHILPALIEACRAWPDISTPLPPAPSSSSDQTRSRR